MRYYIIAGEASGDLHGSNLMKGIYAEDPEAEIRFWGGSLMASVGGTLVQDYKDGAVMGVGDVIAKAGALLGNVKHCQRDIMAFNPDVVILIDYPGFNFKIAKFAHRHGFKVFYYIAPKTWASREGRNRKLKAYVDRLFIVFPFEIPYFESRGIPFIYRGNPLIDAIDGSAAMSEPREEFLCRHGLAEKRCIAILAGSRKGEISRTMPVGIEMADRLHAMPQYRDTVFLVAGAPSRTAADYKTFIGERDYVRLIFGDTYGILRHSDAAMINSGTASLEAALIGTPQVVVYSFAKITMAIARLIVKVRYISLGNLIVDKLVFRELIQEDMNAENVGNEIIRLIEDTPYREEMLSGYAEIRNALGKSGASRAVAEAMIAELRES